MPKIGQFEKVLFRQMKARNRIPQAVPLSELKEKLEEILNIKARLAGPNFGWSRDVQVMGHNVDFWFQSIGAAICIVPVLLDDKKEEERYFYRFQQLRNSGYEVIVVHAKDILTDRSTSAYGLGNRIRVLLIRRIMALRARKSKA